MSIWRFLPSDSCISQLLSIVHDINSSFNCDTTQDARGIFLDISKVFDKVWHEGLLSKLKTYGVKGELLNLLQTIFTSATKESLLMVRSLLGS